MENLNLTPPGPKGPFSENWLVEAILVTILCCLPFGIVGIVYASQVNTKATAGDMEGAEKARKEAAKWIKIGFWVGVVWIILICLFYFILGVTFFTALSNKSY